MNQVNIPIGGVLYLKTKIRTGVVNGVKQYLDLDSIPNFVIIIYRNLKNISLIAKKVDETPGAILFNRIDANTYDVKFSETNYLEPGVYYVEYKQVIDDADITEWPSISLPKQLINFVETGSKAINL